MSIHFQLDTSFMRRVLKAALRVIQSCSVLFFILYVDIRLREPASRPGIPTGKGMEKCY